CVPLRGETTRSRRQTPSWDKGVEEGWCGQAMLVRAAALSARGSGHHGWHVDSGRGERIPQRSQLHFVALPAPDRRTVQRPSHLGGAGCRYGTGVVLKCQATFVPFQAAMGQDHAAVGFLVFDQLLVADFKDSSGEYPVPVRHQPVEQHVIVPDVEKVVRVIEIGRFGSEQLPEVAQARVQRMSANADQPGVGKRICDVPKVEVVLRKLVGEEWQRSPEGTRTLDVVLTELVPVHGASSRSEN